MTATTSDRHAWLEARRQGCGASDVAGILSASPWASPWSVFADKVGLIPIDDDRSDDDDPRNFGLDLEPLIAERFERRTGLYVVDRQTVIHHPEESWCFATLDGLVDEAPSPTRVRALTAAGALGVFESKYTADPPWDTIPDHYQIAGQWQMYVTGLDHLWLACLHLPFGRPQLRIYELDRDDLALADIVATVTTFWLDHIVTGRPPDVDAHPATKHAITLAWGTDSTVKAPSIDLTDHRKLVDQFADLRKQKQTLEWHSDLVENSIKKLIAERGRERPDPDCPTCSGEGIEVSATPDEVDAGCELGVTYIACPFCPTPIVEALSDCYIDGDLAVSWRSQQSTRLDTAKVRADHGTRYDTTSTVRVLRLHGRRKA